MDLAQNNNNNSNNNSNPIHSDVNVDNDLVQFEQTQEYDDNPISSHIDQLPTIGTFENFLHRPARIQAWSWAIGTPANHTISPQRLLMNEPAINNKLKNCSRFRFDLVIRVHVASSPFHYGALLVAWHPLIDLSNDNRIDAYGFPVMTATRGCWTVRRGSAVDLSNKSQKRHVIVYAGDNNTKELIIPFFYPKPYVDMVLSRRVEMMNYGYLTVDSLSNLGSIDTTAASVTIHVTAAFKNTSFAGPTDIDLQSGLIVENGVIITKPPVTDQSTIQLQSGIVNAATNVMAHVSSVFGLTAARPYIAAGHYVAKALELLGFSNKTPKLIVNADNVSNLVGVSAGESTSYVDTTSLGATGIDASVIPGSLAFDEMDVEYFANREMYLGNIMWEEGLATGTILAQFLMSPFLSSIGTSTAVGGNTVVTRQLSPFGYLCTMFRHWRADINLRFVVNCSSMHRGKFMLRYDPAGPSSLSYLTEACAFTKICDLNEGHEFNITIPYMGDNSTLSTFKGAHMYSAGASTGYWGTIGSAPLMDNWYVPEEMNGSLSAFVHSALNSPNPTSSVVSVMVFISAKNVFVNTPMNPLVSAAGLSNATGVKNAIIPNYDLNGSYWLQSGPVEPTYNDTANSGGLESQPISDSIIKLYSGENIKTLKALIQRKMPYNPICSGVNVPGVGEIPTRYLFDNELDLVPKMPTTPKNTGEFENYTKWLTKAGASLAPDWANVVDKYVPMAWLAPCFIGWKGGIRWVLAPRISEPFLKPTSIAVNMSDDPYPTSSGRFFPISGASAASSNSICSTCLHALGSSANGTTPSMSARGYAITSASEVSKLDFVHHDYANVSFQPTSAFYSGRPTTQQLSGAGSVNVVGGIDMALSLDNKARVTVAGVTTQGLGTKYNALTAVDTFVGAHDDFRFVYFNGVPPIDYHYETLEYDFTR